MLGVRGGPAATWHDAGLPRDTLQAMGEQSTPGTAPLVAAVDEEAAAMVEQQRRHVAADVLKEIVDGKVAGDCAALAARQ